MAKLQRRLLGDPDNVREVPLARLEAPSLCLEDPLLPDGRYAHVEADPLASPPCA